MNPYTRECESFAESTLSGKRQIDVNSGEKGQQIIRVMDAAYESARIGRFVPV